MRAPAPYTTSKLQQDAANRLSMQPKRAMRVAQVLYEGVALGKAKGDAFRRSSIDLQRPSTISIPKSSYAKTRRVLHLNARLFLSPQVASKTSRVRLRRLALRYLPRPILKRLTASWQPSQ